MISENIANRIITVLVMLTPHHIFIHSMITWYKYNLHKTHLLINFQSNITFKSSSTVLLTNYNKYFFLRKMRLSIYPHFFSFPLFFKKNLHFQYPIWVFLVFSWYPGILREIKGFRRTDPGIETCGVGQYGWSQAPHFKGQRKALGKPWRTERFPDRRTHSTPSVS